jgi:hypothetical protein
MMLGYVFARVHILVLLKNNATEVWFILWLYGNIFAENMLGWFPHRISACSPTDPS